MFIDLNVLPISGKLGSVVICSIRLWFLYGFKFLLIELTLGFFVISISARSDRSGSGFPLFAFVGMGDLLM